MKFLPMLLLSLIGSLYANSQTNDKCNLLHSFLNSKKVIASFKLHERKDSTLLLIDKNNLFASCKSVEWGNKNLKIVYDSVLCSKLKKTEPYYLFHDSCNYFIIMNFIKNGEVYTVDILQPCSGLETSGKLRKTKSHFVLFKIERYVL